MKMAILTLVVTLAMLELSGAEARKHYLTLDDYFRLRFRNSFQDSLYDSFRYMLYTRDLPPSVKKNNMVTEILRYLHVIEKETLLQYLKDLGDITLKSIYDYLSHHCDEEVKHLLYDLTNPVCARNSLKHLLLSTLEKSADVTMEKCPALCSQVNLTICSTEGCRCGLDHGLRYGQQLMEDVSNTYGSQPPELQRIRNIMAIINNLLSVNFASTSIFFNLAEDSWLRVAKIMSIAPSSELFGYENLRNQGSHYYYSLNANNNEESAWGLVGSSTGTLDHPCSYFKEVYSPNSTEFQYYYKICDSGGIMESIDYLLRCIHKNSTSAPLAWKTVPSIHVHSQCLCVLYQGKDCGVKAPLGVIDFYCLSVLLRDIQRQVSFRPAATYLDYAFMSPVPVCKLTHLLQASLLRYFYVMKDSPEPVLCYFKDLLNKEINCTERLILNSSNVDSIYDTMHFMSLVLCEDEDEDYNDPVTFYTFGASSLVLILHYVDVGLRLLTLVTYLACRQLRNLPGKLLIGYQMVALTRLLAVRSILEYLEDLQLAVYLDVSMDLASTLWLTAYLYFVTHCINTLTPPDSLDVCEARMVLLRSSLIGCVSPAALSAAFFYMDEVLEGHVQVGQLLFVLCNSAALLANITMLYINFKVYYEIRRDALQLQRNLKARQVFADLFNFVIKTSVLSGAGILFRLVFTQIPRLVDVLSYYHALGTFQGLLLFLLYGCNREARVFWVSVWRAMQSRCHLGRNSLELQQRPI